MNSRQEDTKDNVKLPTTHFEFVKRANLSASELNEFRKANTARCLVDITSTISFVFAIPFVYWLVPTYITAAACILSMIHAFNCFSQLVHASSHNELFHSAAANSLFGNFCAYFLGFSRLGHAASHHSHHIHLNTENDPDRVFLRMTDPRTETVSRMLLMSLYDFAMFSAFRRLLQYLQTDKRRFDARPWKHRVLDYILRGIKLQMPVAVLHLAILSYYSLTIGALYYFLFYIFPLFSLYVAQSRLRFFVEHAFELGYTPRSSDNAWITRSTDANVFERFLFAPLSMEYHFEHHLFPTVPYYNLRRLHLCLKDRGAIPPVANGYIGFLIERWRQETARDRSQTTLSRQRAAA